VPNGGDPRSDEVKHEVISVQRDSVVGRDHSHGEVSMDCQHGVARSGRWHDVASNSRLHGE